LTSALCGTPEPLELQGQRRVNERRKRLIQRIEACGAKVSVFEQPTYADERDQHIRQVKAVLNCHVYESATFEQVCALHCLSLGVGTDPNLRLGRSPMGKEKVCIRASSLRFAVPKTTHRVGKSLIRGPQAGRQPVKDKGTHVLVPSRLDE
jgi:hypothetical protein